MGFFSFLKFKSDPLAALQDNRLTRDFTLAAELESIEKRVGNLRLVGRGVDARELICKLLRKLLECWRDEPSNPAHLRMFATASLRLDTPEVARKSLESVIATCKESRVLDLTTLYLELGVVYERLGLPIDDQFVCYQNAAKASPASDARYAATRKQKAKAHYYAHLAAARILLEDEATWHLSRAIEFAPGVNFDDKRAVESFFEERSATLTPDVANYIAELVGQLHGNVGDVQSPPQI